MKIDCKNKCENKNCENKTNSSYIKRIIKLIGPVILGSKPSEIVNIPGCPEEKIIKLNEIEAFFGNCKKVKYKIINVHDGSKRVLFIKNFFNDTATTEIYTLSLHDALPILQKSKI